MNPEDVNKWAVILGISGPFIGALIVFIFVLCNIEKFFLMSSKIQSLFTGISSKARKGTISTAIRGKVIKVAKNHKNLDDDLMIRDLKIEWVKDENPVSFMKNNQVIIRLNHDTNPHKNYVTAVSTFVNQGLLVKARRYVDSNIMRATSFSVTRSFILNGDNEALDYYDESILKPVLQEDDELSNLLDELKTIDGNGMFFEILLNEYAKAARKLYPDIKGDPCFTAESKEFLYYLHRIATGVASIPDDLCFNREYFKVHIFLAANTRTYIRSGAKVYLKHIFKSIDEGTETLYIYGLGKKMEIAKELAEEAGHEDFRIEKIIPHYYKHRSLKDSKRINGVCIEVQIYKDNETE